MDCAHSATDVEDRLPLDAAGGQRIDQRPGRPYRTLLTIGAKMIGGVARVELAVK